MVCILALGACVDMDTAGKPIEGTSGDVVTEPGDYLGYRVVLPCEDRYVNIGVIGTGAVELTEVADISTVGQELALSMRGDMPSIHSWGGYGLSCEPGIGTSLTTDNWKDVDAIISRVGQYLRERDYAVQVGIRVESIPVAH
jgi:hypothetical protein